MEEEGGGEIGSKEEKKKISTSKPTTRSIPKPETVISRTPSPY